MVLCTNATQLKGRLALGLEPAAGSLESASLAWRIGNMNAVIGVERAADTSIQAALASAEASDRGVSPVVESRQGFLYTCQSARAPREQVATQNAKRYQEMAQNRAKSERNACYAHHIYIAESFRSSIFRSPDERARLQRQDPCTY